MPLIITDITGQGLCRSLVTLQDTTMTGAISKQYPAVRCNRMLFLATGQGLFAAEDKNLGLLDDHKKECFEVTNVFPDLVATAIAFDGYHLYLVNQGLLTVVDASSAPKLAIKQTIDLKGSALDICTFDDGGMMGDEGARAYVIVQPATVLIFDIDTEDEPTLIRSIEVNPKENLRFKKISGWHDGNLIITTDNDDKLVTVSTLSEEPECIIVDSDGLPAVLC